MVDKRLVTNVDGQMDIHKSYTQNNRKPDPYNAPCLRQAQQALSFVKNSYVHRH